MSTQFDHCDIFSLNSELHVDTYWKTLSEKTIMVFCSLVHLDSLKKYCYRQVVELSSQQTFPWHSLQILVSFLPLLASSLSLYFIEELFPQVSSETDLESYS